MKAILSIILLCFCFCSSFGQSESEIEIEPPPPAVDEIIPDADPANFILKQGVQLNKKTHLYGFIDSNLNIAIPFIYESLYYESPNFIIAKKNRKKGIIDINQRVIHDFIYNDFKYGGGSNYVVALIGDNKETMRCHLFDKKSGKEIISLKEGYNYIYIEKYETDSELYFKALKFSSNIVDILNTEGIKVNSFNYSNVVSFGDYWFTFLNNKQGLLTKDGDVILKPDYDHIFWVKDGFICASNDNKAIIINLSLDTIFKSEYYFMNRLSDNGYFIVNKDREYKHGGIVNSEYKEVFPICNCSIRYNDSTKLFEVTDNISREVSTYSIKDLNLSRF